MKELPAISHIYIGSEPLTSLMSKGEQNFTAQVLSTENGPSSPEIIGNLNATEAAVTLVGIGMTALSYGIARRFTKGTDHWDEWVAPFVASGAFAAATGFYLVNALSSK